ncbi:MAG: periplasmic heavy metal sensor [Deltaproteobacteria bacterium]|nr:periplasmic heavy metal sensor [Deltaproteobacteria bacterium]
MKKRMKSMAIALVFGMLASLSLPGNAVAEEDYRMERPQMSGQRGGDNMKGPGRGGSQGGMKGNMPPGQWWRMPGAAEKLGLGREEQKRLDELYMTHRREMITLKGDVEKEKLEFEYLIDKETIDEQAVKGQFEKLHNARGKMSMARFSFLLEVRKILGYERYQKLKSEFQQRRMMRGDRGGRRPMGDERGEPRR